jgi:3-dehydroquinate dehydratase/shikimate dehydrogenase
LIRICVSILPKTIDEALVLFKKAESLQVDFIEVRLDHLRTINKLNELISHRKTPLIATDREKKNESERKSRLLEAAHLGFDYVDVDLSSPKLQNFVSEAKASGSKCIVSSHDMNKTPSIKELNRILEREVSSGADVYKIVTSANKIGDNLTLLQFVQSISIKKKPVCFAMGELGRMSRLLSPAFGSFFTFASLESGRETASGQMSVQEMRAVYELLGIQ